MRYDERRRIRREEEVRQEAREDIARRRYREQEKQVERIIRHQTYVNLKGGPEKAFWAIVKKWAVGGSIFAALSILFSIGDEDFFKNLTGAIYIAIFAVGIGIYRGYTVLKSARND
jgi:hypothetical protein